MHYSICQPQHGKLGELHFALEEDKGENYSMSVERRAVSVMFS
jgi:hypothetical protein